MTGPARAARAAERGGLDIGVGVALGGNSLRGAGDFYRELWDQGFTSFWSGEIDGPDGFAPLHIGAAAVPEAHFATGIVSPYLRGPALLAMSAAGMADAAPGRFALGLGPGSPRIIEDWNGGELSRPYQRMRDTVRFLQAAFSGEKVEADFETFSVRGFRLGLVPEQPPPVLLAALRPDMLRLASREADGVILNWVSPDDVRRSLAACGPQGEVACRIYVNPGLDRAQFSHDARRLLAVYANVEAYAAQQSWLGRGELLGETWDAWARGDRREAAEALPERVLDDLFITGSPEACHARVAEYVAAGVTRPILTLFPLGADPATALRTLSPAAMGG
ncbi:MAG: LLM class F420-dependent oxidoreductase [Acidimicrobiia bacterium]|nr:LLM class F420-dependent oxidoreductase [Acidimicrobiia bacterium]